MKTGKLFRLILMGVLSLASLVVLSGQEAQASPRSNLYCNADGTKCNCDSDGNNCRGIANVVPSYRNFRNKMSKPGGRLRPNPEVSRRMAATAALSWVL